MRPAHLLAGATAFAASVAGGYFVAKPAKQLSHHTEQQHSDIPGCAFDRLADIYDDVIGSEEKYMWYGLLRKWLLRKAQVWDGPQHMSAAASQIAILSVH